VVIDARRLDAGIPVGTARLALQLAERAAAAAGALTGHAYRIDPLAVLAHVLLPLVVGDAPTVPAPRPVTGGGWVHADVLAEDEDLLALLAAEGGDAEALATASQACRLPVTPYRSGAAAWEVPPTGPAAVRRLEPGAVSVLDLTAMWAGPLATMLLGAWGADVVTVEPPVRPDGLRGSPAQFAILDRAKRRRPWDLRAGADRAAFDDAVRAADVLVESFSSRVLGNLGYDRTALRRLNPELVVVAVRAFPSTGPDATWVAYGRGVHAAGGLGMVEGVPQPALLAYPDPLAGLAAFGAVLDALGTGGPVDVEVSLAASIAPLLATAGEPLGELDASAIVELRAGTGGRPGPVIVAA
jgi:hypothetical protein